MAGVIKAKCALKQILSGSSNLQVRLQPRPILSPADWRILTFPPNAATRNLVTGQSVFIPVFVRLPVSEFPRHQWQHKISSVGFPEPDWRCTECR